MSAIDGTAFSNGVGVTSLTVTLSTTNTNDIIYVVVAGNENTFPIVSVSDSAGLTWNSRGSESNGGEPLPMGASASWAVAAEPLSGDEIVVTLDETMDATIIAFGISGTDVNNPFDPLFTPSFFPQSGYTDTGPTQAIGVSTSSSTPFVVSMLSGTADTTASWGYASGYTDIQDDTSLQPTIVLYTTYQKYDSALNNATITWSNSSSTNYEWFIIMDAFVSPPTIVSGSSSNAVEGVVTVTSAYVSGSIGDEIQGSLKSSSVSTRGEIGASNLGITAQPSAYVSGSIGDEIQGSLKSSSVSTRGEIGASNLGITAQPSAYFVYGRIGGTISSKSLLNVQSMMDYAFAEDNISVVRDTT